MRSKILLGLLLLTLAACDDPRLPDPSIEYPVPPAALMEPSQNLQTIPTGDNTIVN